MAKRTQKKKASKSVKRGRRYELSDEGFERLAPLLPKQNRGGRWNDHRTTLNGIFWVLNSGAPWRDMPERYGRWQSVYHRFRRWVREGLFDRMLHRLHVQLDDDGRIDWSQFDIDGSSVRADRSAAGGGKKGAKQSRTTTPWDDPAEALARSFIW